MFIRTFIICVVCCRNTYYVCCSRSKVELLGRCSSRTGSSRHIPIPTTDEEEDSITRKNGEAAQGGSTAIAQELPNLFAFCLRLKSYYYCAVFRHISAIFTTYAIGLLFEFPTPARRFNRLLLFVLYYLY